MFETAVEQRVTDLEGLMAEVWRTIERVDRQIERTQRHLDQTQHRIDQTQRQIDQTQRQIEQTQRQIEQTQHRIDQTQRQIEQTHHRIDQLSREMQTFKEEMQAFREESNRSRIEMNRKWGELANKMGTMAEDLVAPSIPRILRQTVPCPDGRAESVAVHMRRLHPADPGREREFDVVAVCGEYVLINETKSRLTIQNVEDFTHRMPEAREFFPEYAGKKFVGAIASLYVDESVVRFGEKQGLIVLGFGEDVMEVLNTPGFIPRAF